MSQRLTTGVIAQGKRVVDPLAGITGIVQRYRYTDIFTGIGNPVESWMNIGTQGGSAVGTIGMRPTLESDGVYADGVDDFLDIASLSGLSAASYFILAKNTLDPPLADLGAGPWLGKVGSYAFSSHTPFTDGNIYDAFATTDRKTVGNPATPLTDWFVYEASSAEGYWQAWLNGVSVFSTADNTVGFGPNPALFGDGDYRWGGICKEIIILDRASPTLDGDRTIIRNYLNGLIP